MSKHLHFIGICGTAMGSTAVAMRQLGYSISGSDEKVYPPMSEVCVRLASP
jgi:UDP-N-acetylmuramate: L-alanyl-gamma-D-glutamyl-meso-diaminopimelate ligase